MANHGAKSHISRKLSLFLKRQRSSFHISLSKKAMTSLFLNISTFFTLLSFRNPSLQKLDYHLASLSNQIRSHLVHDCIKVFLDAPDLSIRNDLFEERLEVGVPGQNAKHVFGVSPDLQGAIWQHFGAICIHTYLKTKKDLLYLNFCAKMLNKIFRGPTLFENYSKCRIWILDFCHFQQFLSY